MAKSDVEALLLPDFFTGFGDENTDDWRLVFRLSFPFGELGAELGAVFLRSLDEVTSGSDRVTVIGGAFAILSRVP